MRSHDDRYYVRESKLLVQVTENVVSVWSIDRREHATELPERGAGMALRWRITGNRRGMQDLSIHETRTIRARSRRRHRSLRPQYQMRVANIRPPRREVPLASQEQYTSVRTSTVPRERPAHPPSSPESSRLTSCMLGVHPTGRTCTTAVKARQHTCQWTQGTGDRLAEKMR